MQARPEYPSVSVFIVMILLCNSEMTPISAIILLADAELWSDLTHRPLAERPKLLCLPDEFQQLILAQNSRPIFTRAFCFRPAGTRADH
jgi:hypothetical protein